MRISALIALLLLNLAAAWGQTISSSVINTTGNSYTQGYYSIDWSVGELPIVSSSRSTDGNYIITNGFLQPETISGNPNRLFSGDEIKIFPNPTYGKIEIDFATLQQGTVHINVYDTYGRLVISNKTVSYGTGSIERLDLSKFAAGTYFLKIILDPALGSVPKNGTYKIVKY